MLWIRNIWATFRDSTSLSTWCDPEGLLPGSFRRYRMGSTGESREHVSSIHRPPFSLRGARWRHCRYAINTATVRHIMQRKQKTKNTKKLQQQFTNIHQIQHCNVGWRFWASWYERESSGGHTARQITI